MAGLGTPGVFAVDWCGSCLAGARDGVRKGRGRGEEASSTLPELGHRQAALRAVLQVGSVPPRQQTDSSQIKQLIWHWDREQTALLGTVCPDTGQLHN